MKRSLFHAHVVSLIKILVSLVLFRNHCFATSRNFAPSRGFTLLELLVALLLLSLIFLLLTSGLQFGTRAWNVGQEEPNSTSEVVAVQQLLRRVLSEARPLIIEATPTVRRHVFFVGNQNSVRFIAPVPEHLGVGGLYEVALYLTDDGGSTNRLEMSWRLFRGAEGSEVRRVALLDKVAQIQFSYFGRPLPQGSPRWYGDWQDLESLPDLIRMHVTLSGGEPVWPDLTVATHVQTLNVVIDGDGA
jgi:general secretion pathway protein J